MTQTIEVRSPKGRIQLFTFHSFAIAKHAIQSGSCPQSLETSSPLTHHSIGYYYRLRVGSIINRLAFFLEMIIECENYDLWPNTTFTFSIFSVSSATLGALYWPKKL
jgi:hypothetical protein